ncbi:hypothetical protein HPT27_15835 [Permianibacter sp. IMCC34836]|uniref:hypothetical protein n=1 Tax=Permianibacter fluminis TaxID=2738515 RepID=UPI001556864D|nr:hypothetical protein [Permianibacter fluminis]NQD38493.1 hypothetical protein [Permianibacter fluminis]
MHRYLPRTATTTARRAFAQPLLASLFGVLLLSFGTSSHAANNAVDAVANGGKAAASHATAGKPASTLFSERERNAILSHYAARQHDAEVYAQYHESSKGKKDGNKHSDKALPPGLQKQAEQGRLPPGWQKKLKIGSKVPPDIFAVAEVLPPALIAQLPAGPAGTITVHVDGQIIRVVEATRTIVDFFGLSR